MHGPMSSCSYAAQLDRWIRQKVLEPQKQSGLALRERQNQDPADSAPVSGRDRQNLQDHSGDLLQMQKILTAAQRIGKQV